MPSRTAHNWNVLGRLRDGVTLAQARRETSAIAKTLRQQYGDETWMYDAHLVPLRDQIVGDVRPALVVLLAASGFLLLIGCANVVNLLVARMAARQGELALRLALGAGRRRLVKQFLTEALVLSLCGGVLGVALGVIGVRSLLALEPGRLPRLNEVGVHWPVLLFALAVSVVCALALGLLTAWRATRGDIRETLAQSQRTQAGSGASHRIRSGLVVAQVALTLVLLVGAGLLAHSFVRLLSVDPGFHADHAVVMDVDVPASDSSSTQRMVQLYDELMTRFAGIQGVRAVGGANVFPLAGGGTGNGAFIVMSTPTEKLDFAQLPSCSRTRLGPASPNSASRARATSRRCTFRSSRAGSSTTATARRRCPQPWSAPRSRRSSGLTKAPSARSFNSGTWTVICGRSRSSGSLVTFARRASPMIRRRPSTPTTGSGRAEPAASTSCSRGQPNRHL